MELAKIIGIGFVTALSAILLKNTKPELSFAVTVAGIIVILSFVVELMQTTFSELESLATLTGVGNGLVKILLKAVGIGFVTEFGAGILKDFGNVSVADKVSLAGKLCIILLAMPIFKSLVDLLVALMKVSNG